MIHPHPLYTALDKIPEQRQFSYRELFRVHLDSDKIHEIRDALNQNLCLAVKILKIK